MSVELHSLWRSLHDGEYLYLVLESLLPFGLAAGVLFLAVGMGLADMRVRAVGLAVILCTALTVWPATEMRASSLPRLLAMTEEVTFQKLMTDQATLRASWNGLYYFLAAVSGLTLLLTLLKKARLLTLLALLMASGCALHALWLHKKECEVFHRNIVKNHAV